MQRILYRGRNAQTGINDILIDIYNASNTKVVSQATMSELGGGLYYYDYDPATSGWFSWNADSFNAPGYQFGQFYSDLSTSSTVTSLGSSTYATTLQLANFLNLVSKVPNIASTGTARAKEDLGVGDGSNLLFYTDQSRIINGTYAFYYGATESAALPLTENTHYTIDIDAGIVTLTTTGRTLVSTNHIYGSYSYLNLELTDTQLSNALSRAQSSINKRLLTIFCDGTTSTPGYSQVTDEKQRGQGMYDVNYSLEYFPLPDVSTTVDGDVTASNSTITVTSTDGFNSSGTIGIGDQKISYSGKTGTTFTGCTGNDAAITDGSTVLPYVVEISTSAPGTALSWTVLSEGTDFDLDIRTGMVQLMNNPDTGNASIFSMPPEGIANRFRASYLYGVDTVPDEINLLCVMLAAKEIVHIAGKRNFIVGQHEFRVENINIDDLWIESTFSKYLNMKSSRI